MTGCYDSDWVPETDSAYSYVWGSVSVRTMATVRVKAKAKGHGSARWVQAARYPSRDAVRERKRKESAALGQTGWRAAYSTSEPREREIEPLLVLEATAREKDTPRPRQRA